MLAAAPARADQINFSSAVVAPSSPLFPGTTATFTVKVVYPSDPSNRYVSKRVVEKLEGGLVLAGGRLTVNGQPVPCGTQTAALRVQCGVKTATAGGLVVANVVEDLTSSPAPLEVASQYLVTEPLGDRVHGYEATCADLIPGLCAGPAAGAIPYTVKELRLGLTKAGPPTAAAGTPFDYTITVSNPEAVAAYGVAVSDTPPADALEPVAVVVGAQTFGPAPGVFPLAPDGEVRITAQPAWSVSVRPPGAAGQGAMGFLGPGASFGFVVRVKTRFGVDPARVPAVTNTARARPAAPSGPEVSAAAETRLGGAAAVTLKKEAFGPSAARSTQARAGDTVLFRLTVTPAGAAVGPITVVDPAPPGTRVTALTAGGTRLPCPAARAVGVYQVSCGDPRSAPAAPVRIVLPPGAAAPPGPSVFDVEAQVLLSAAPGTLTNTATITDAAGLTQTASAGLVIVAPGVPGGVNLALRADRPVASKGDLVPLRATVGFYQAYDPAAGTLRVEVQLARDLIPLTGTGSLATDAGQALGPVAFTAEGDRIVFAWPRQAVAAGAVQVLTFRTRVATRAAAGTLHPRAAATRDGRTLASAEAALLVAADPELDLATLLGAVYRDENGDGRRDPGEAGVPGVMVVLEDGLQAVTDDEGRYHLAAVRPGQRVVKVARHLLPPGAVVTTHEVRVLTLTRGQLAVVDFGVRIPPVAPAALPPEPALDEAPAARPLAGGGLAFTLTGAVRPGARVRVGTPDTPPLGWAAATVDARGRYRAEVTLRPGRNRLALIVADPDGRVSLYGRDVFLVRRAAGGDLVVPRPAEPRLALRFPPGAFAGQDYLLEGSAPAARPALLKVSGVAIAPDARGRFGVRLRFPKDAALAGVPVEVAFPDGFAARFVHDLGVGGDYLLLLGLAEGRLGYVTSTKGAGGRDGLHAEGRIALYLRGQIQGRYLIEGALDVDDQIRSVTDLFRGDPRAVFRQLDPDRFYPVYGDASATVQGAERRGRLFVAVRVGASELRLGNFMTGLTGVELGRYSRALSGGRAELVLAGPGRGVPPRTRVVVFGAWLQTQRAHDELRGTGGSLYFLRHRDVVEGSEQVRIEVRDQISGIPVTQTPQRPFVDYEIDNLGGRVTMRAPVNAISAGPSVVRSTPHSGDQLVVIVDYEYVVVDPADDVSVGARAQQRLGPVRIGGTLVNELRSSSDYTLAGLDLALDLGRHGSLLFEYAYSNGRLDGFATSIDGGLTYRDRRSPVTDTQGVYSTYGSAFKAEGDLRAGGGGYALSLKPYFRLIQRGFTDTAHVDERDVTQFGGELDARGPFGLRLVGRYDERRFEGADAAASAWRRDGGGEVRGLIGRLTLTAGVRHEEARDAFEDGGRTAVALRAEVPVSPRLKLYGLYQQNLEHHGAGLVAQDNTMGAAGAELRLRAAGLTLRGEGGYGVQGPLGLAGVQSDLGQGRLLYGTYTFSTDADDRIAGVFAAGGRQRAAGSRAELFAEDQFRRDGYGRAEAQVAGVQVPLGKRVTVTGAYERGRLDDGATLTDRNAGSAAASYAGDRLRLQGKLELRRDTVQALATPTGAPPDPSGTTSTGEPAAPSTPPGERTQVLAAAAATVRAHRDLWLRGRFMFTRSLIRDSAAPERKPEVEGTVGFAWRPAFVGGLAVLGRYTYLIDAPQSADDPLIAVYRQRSHIASLAGEVKLVRWLSLGEKVAYKSVREMDAATPVPAGANEQGYILWINRLSLHVTRTWDAAAEYRFLFTAPALPGEDDAGALLEINRILFGHVRLGAGWNFSQTPTDERVLGRLREHGFFVRAQGFM
ncbi:MAG TPA: SdrD B-like domain-containing protein [Polyangia bacterium]